MPAELPGRLVTTILLGPQRFTTTVQATLRSLDSEGPVAMVNAGPTNYELIQPVAGAVDLYRQGIRPGAVATFHHVGYRVDSFAEASAVLAAEGRSWKQYGDMGEAVKFGYVDLTEELGHYAEVMELGPGMRSVFARLERESNGG